MKINGLKYSFALVLFFGLLTEGFAQNLAISDGTQSGITSSTSGSVVTYTADASGSPVLNVDTIIADLNAGRSVTVISSGSITVSSNISGSGNGAGVVLKAIGDIVLEQDKSIITNGGDVVFWSDSDASGTTTTAGGTIALLASSSIATSGGNIVLAGGTDTNMDGVPDGYAIGAFINNPARGADNATNGLFLDGANLDAATGNILLRGQGTGSGFNFQIGTRLYGGYIIGANIQIEGKGSILGSSSSNWGLSLEGFSIEGSGVISLFGWGGRAGSFNNDVNQVGVEIRAALDDAAKLSQIKATGSGTIAIDGIGGSGTFAAPSFGFSADGIRIQPSLTNPILSADGNITLNGTSGYNGRGIGVNIMSPISSTNGNIRLKGIASVEGTIGVNGNISIDAAISTAGDLNLESPGSVIQTSAITVDGLGLHGTGTFTLTNASNNVVTIAGGDNTTKLGSLSFVDVSGGLAIGSVNPTGITSTGPILIETLTGDITISNNVATDDNSADAIIINAGKDSLIGVLAGGNIKILGSPTITAGSGGITKLFSGSVSGSSGLSALVGGTSNVRLGVDETTTTFDPVLVSGNKYALYRDICGTQIGFKLSPPNVSTSPLQGQTGSRTEDFNSFAVGNVPSSGTYAIGNFTKTASGTNTRYNLNSEHGAPLPNSSTLSTFLGIYSNDVITVTLTDSSRYLGFWWAGGDASNKITIYGSCGGSEVQLAQFTTSSVTTLLSGTNITAIDGNVYNSDDYRRPASGNEPFAYINLELDDPNIYFTRLELTQDGPWTFEIDNITTSTVYGAASPPTGNFSCLNQSTIPLGDSCVAILSSGMFTLPTSNGLFIYAHETDIPSSFQPGEIGSLDSVYGEGEWMYGIYSATPDEKGLHQLICWGTFSTEDKIDPFFVGDKSDESDDLGTVFNETLFNQFGTYKLVEYETWQANLGAGYFNPHLWSCWQSTNHANQNFTWPNIGARSFDSLTFTATRAGYLTLFVASELNTSTGAILGRVSAFDPVVAVYGKGGFSAENPCENMIAFGESTFIPNPLAGLGYANELGESDLSGAGQDAGDIFAPWLLHEQPIVRMTVKVEEGQQYTLVITHREDLSMNSIPSPDAEVFFVLYPYDAQGATLGTNAQPRRIILADDILPIDTSIAYFDFLCGDLSAVMLPSQKTYTQEQYRTGANRSVASSILDVLDGGDGDVAPLDYQDLNAAWYELGQSLVGIDSQAYLPFIDLERWNLPGEMGHLAGQDVSVDSVGKWLMEFFFVDYGFKPMVIENCGEYTVEVSDSYQAYGDCGIDYTGIGQYTEGYNVSGIITRTYLVRDAGTKTDPDTATIQLIFRNPTLYDVRLPHYTVNIECDEITGEGLPSPAVTGYPFIASLTGFKDLTPNSPFCNLAAGYEDKAIVTNCANNKELRREWTLYDWCRPGTTIIYNQLIRVGDWTKPSFTAGSTGYHSVGFSAQECSGNVSIKPGEATDKCSEVTISIWVYEGNAIRIDNEVAYSGSLTTRNGITASAGTNGALNVSGLPQGEYTTLWVAKDACGNSDSLSSTFTITDNISPSCVIDDVRTITLTNFQVGGNAGNANPRGEAYLTADRLDEGSWDNCHEVSVQIRRMTATGMTAWADQVGFTCEDEGDSVLVEMVARAGNDSTICWTYIKVEDKTIPECREIGTVTMVCSDLPVGDLSAGSSVWNQFFADSITVTKTSIRQLCNIEFDANIETEVKIDQCGYGWVNRYYRVYRTIDNKEFADTCRMSVVFSEDHDYWVTFPADEEEKECGSLEEVKVTYHEGGCDLITISKNDQKFDATADECYKILRTYRVINWCEYDGGEVPYKVERRDWNRDGVMGDATTVNVKYRQGVKHVYKDYKGRYVTVVGAEGSLNPTGAAQSDADLRDTVYRVGAEARGTDTVYWETSIPQALSTSAKNHKLYSSSVKVIPVLEEAILQNNYAPQGFFEYTQHLKVYDEVAPEIEVLTEDLNFASYSNDKDNGCPGAVSISVSISDDCTSNLTELVVRDVLLDAGNDNAGSVTYVTRKYDASSYQGTTLYKAEYEAGTLTISSTGLPIGEHKFTVVGSDGCGNVQTKDIVFEVEDKKGPAPVCIEGFAVELMPVGLDGSGRMATVNAVDFVVNKPIEDCHDDSGVYLITRMRSTDGNTKTAAEVVATAATETTLTLTCADWALNQPIQVAVIATDGVGNKDYCVTTINVQDNVTPCAASATVAGLIATEENSVVSGVEVSLNASATNVTAVDGGYLFSGLALGGDYSIAPKKDAGYLNGVSTFDLVLISKHILNLQVLNSPYKLIAADVNNSGTISTLDLIQLRRVILALDNGFVNNTSWRFVPANYTFPVTSNPWSATFPEVLNINNLAGSVNGDFVAIKVGDVNNSAVIDVQPRSNATFAMNVEDIAIKAGNEYTVNFTSNASDVEGFQMALSYRGLELVDIVEGIAKVENFGTKFTGEGVVLTSWNGTAANGNMFGLVFRATQDSKLSEALSVTSRHMNAEAYNNAGEAMNVALNFNSGVVAEAAFELRQNMPNPFKGETMIGFNLAEASSATLTINDVTGRVLKVVRGDFAKGANQISLNSKDLPASGVLYYTLTAGEYTATKKMIILN
jgi:hypothetical protein